MYVKAPHAEIPMQKSPSQNSHSLDRGTILVAGVVLLGAMLVDIDLTAVNVALGPLATDLDAPFTTIQWVVSGYALALAAVIPIAGWAADRFGEKLVYITALGIFAAGSALCGIAWSPASLIAFRVVQACGGGLILPLVTTVISRKAGPHRRGRLIGLFSVPLLLAPLLAPIVGGWMLEDVSWRAIFLINVPLGAVAALLAWKVLDRDEPRAGERLDWIGLALLSPGLALFLFGCAGSTGHGFRAAQVWLSIFAGVLCIGAFAFRSFKAPMPLIDVRAFIQTRAGLAALTLLFLAVALFGAWILMPIYFEVIRGFSPLEAGFLLAPQALGVMITLPIAGWIVDHHNPFWLPIASVPVMVAGILPFALLTSSTPVGLLCAANFVLGLGLGLIGMPATTAALQSVPERKIARTSTALSVVNQSGASIGAALFSVLLAAALPASAVGGIDALGTHGADGGAAASVQTAAAFGTTFVWIMLAVAAIAIPALALALLENPRSRDPGPDGDEELSRAGCAPA